MLPCLIFFQNGVACDRAVGFDEYGASDNFPTTAVERRLLKSGECLQLLPEWLPNDDHDFLHNIQLISSSLVAFSPSEGKELLQMPHQRQTQHHSNSARSKCHHQLKCTYADEVTILIGSGVVHAPKKKQDDDDQYMPEHVRHSVRKSAEGHSSSDEDSDFD